MITQELLGYIKGEVAKGKTREEVRGILMRGGGWTDDDISEAFREIVPMQSVVLPKETIINPIITPRTTAPVIPIVSTVSSVPPVATINTASSFKAPSLSSFSTVSPTQSAPTPTPSLSSSLNSSPTTSQSSYSPSSDLLKPIPTIIRPQNNPSPSYTASTTTQPSYIAQSPASILSPLSASMPTMPGSRMGTSSVKSSHAASNILKFLIILIIIGGLGLGGWYYRSQAMSVWNSGVQRTSNFVISFFNKSNSTPPPAPVADDNIVTPPPPAPPAPTPVEFKDCGVTNKPDPSVPSSYQNNAVLDCLGTSALNCVASTAVFQDKLFPTIVQINKNADGTSCNFNLSYAPDSTLVDVNGNQLADQYISCPLSIVKAVDQSNPKSITFNPPTISDNSKYASEIYFFGTIGVFIENNLDQNQIETLGCQGSFIDSMIASYKLAQSKTTK